MTPSNRARGIVVAAAGAAGLVLASSVPRLRPVGLTLGLLFLFLAGTAFGRASGLATSLRPFVGRPVRVEVWGASLPGSGEARYEVASIMAFGAALLIHLRAVPGGRRILLKVAQPGSGRVEDNHLEVADARYISWNGTRLPRSVGVAALVLAMEDDPSSGLEASRS